ncbi:HAD-IA family hydrolase [uncultured Gimesia sp.]|uniref:HAD-IA family hydrolase n=1 Tax=uncultured Gimesia sp. TaxID=1678688 RepID=UPI00261DB1FE|nr:HAD-IA family hydrolase [uncultured Gimesia sp.]
MIKPRKGHGSEGIRYIENINELSRQLETLAPDDCLQEYVEGDEITCGLLFDKQGNLADSLAMVRTLKNGRTISASVYENTQLDDFINSFAEKTKLIGPINLQLRMNQAGQPLVFEINPRLSGSTLMRIAVGFNDPARIVEHFLDDLPVRRAKVDQVKVYRTEATLTVVGPKTSQPREKHLLQNRNEIKHIVFDCGGTLLHLVPDRAQVCQEVLRQLGYEISTEQINLAYELVNFSLRHRSSLVRTAKEKQDFYHEFNGRLAIALGISSQHHEFNSLLQRAFADRCHWSPLPGVISTLNSLATRAGYTLHVLANWNSGLSDLLLKTELAHFFCSIHHSEGLGVEKPDPDIFLAFAGQTGVTPQQALYIGNEYEADVHGSRAAGFTPILLDLNHRYTNLIDCMLVRDWHQLRELLDSLLSEETKGKSVE